MDQEFIIKCPRHPKRLCEVFTSQISSPYCLLCPECFQEEAILPLSLVSIDDILSGSNDSILKNWPPLGSQTQDIFQNLIKVTSSFDTQTQLSQIVNFFDKAEHSIIEALRNKKKEILSQIATVSQNSELLIKDYKQIAQIESLKEALTSSRDPNQIEQNLRTIISNQTKKSQSIYEQLESIIKESQLSSTLSLDEAQLTVNKLIESLSLIKLLPSKQTSSLPQKKESQINFELEVEQKSQQFAVISNYQQNDSQFKIKTFKSSNTENKDIYCQMINTLKSNKKYILKLRLINKSIYASSVELIPLNVPSNGDQIIAYFHYGNSSFSTPIKGQEIWSETYYRSKRKQYENKVASIELRICIKEKYIVVLDRPSYSNAIPLSSWSPDKFMSNTDYRVRLYIYGLNDTITVEELREVDTFPNI